MVYKNTIKIILVGRIGCIIELLFLWILGGNVNLLMNWAESEDIHTILRIKSVKCVMWDKSRVYKLLE